MNVESTMKHFGDKRMHKVAQLILLGFVGRPGAQCTLNGQVILGFPLLLDIFHREIPGSNLVGLFISYTHEAFLN